MKRVVGMSLFGVGIALGGLAKGSAHGFMPWPIVLGGHALLIAAVGLMMTFSGPGVGLGNRLEWRVRGIGIALALMMTVLWRGLIGAAAAAQVPPLGWVVGLGATALLLVPALFCWGYVLATFLPWRMRYRVTVPAGRKPVAV